jgi:hypothetical protein
MRLLATLARKARDLTVRLGASAGEPATGRRGSVSPRGYANAAGGGCFHRELRGGRVQRASLPGNVGRPDELPRERRPWGFSFRDVLERPVNPRCVARLPGCRILPFRDRWGSEYHALRTADGRRLRLHGSAVPGGATALSGGDDPDLGEVAWIVGRWHRNYYHWLLYHLPKVLVLEEEGAERALLVPGPGKLRPVIEASLLALGLDPASLRTLPEGPARAGPVWVVESDRFDPDLLRALRSRIAGPPGPADRLVYIGREQARRRRLANDAELLRALEAQGFASVHAEAIAFSEQVALASRTRILVGVHGAGLTNMLFMPEGAHVIEIANPRYPSPAFYALAAALGLRYWLVWGNPSDARGRDALDVEVDPRRVAVVIDAIGRERS